MPLRQLDLRASTSPLRLCGQSCRQVLVAEAAYSANALYICLCFTLARGTIFRRCIFGHGRLLKNLPLEKNL